MVRKWAKLVVLVCLVGCGSSRALRVPTDLKPLAGCHITCVRGNYTFRTQHRCQGSRYMDDITIVGRFTERGPDGAVNKDVWIGCEGWGWDSDNKKRTCVKTADFPVEDVELGSCRSYISTICMGAGANCAHITGENLFGDSETH